MQTLAERHDDTESTVRDSSNVDDIPEAARAIFGDRVDLAHSYRKLLATQGIDHGLIGPREVPRLWERHILNCAVIGEQIADGESVVDVGSGAGLPGIPLAIARPDLDVILLEPLLRRSSFLERVVEELGLSGVRVVRGRAEEANVRAVVGGRDVATSRAVAPLDRLSAWSAPLLRSGGRLVAIKGASAAEEIERDAKATQRAGITQLRIEMAGASLLPSPTTVVVGVRSEADRGPGRYSAKRRGRKR